MRSMDRNYVYPKNFSLKSNFYKIYQGACYIKYADGRRKRPLYLAFNLCSKWKYKGNVRLILKGLS
jgi:hypothetical protein